MRARAPGKVVLSGAFAVLSGARVQPLPVDAEAQGPALFAATARKAKSQSEK